MVGGEADDFDESVVSGLLLSAEGSVPRMRSAAVAGDVEEEDGVHLLGPQFGGDVLAVALDRHKLGQILPLALKQVLAAGLAVKHFVAEPRVELLRTRLCHLQQISMKEKNE